jgi:malonate decarboxylase alpha subunit
MPFAKIHIRKYKATSLDERRWPVAAVAGATPVGRHFDEGRSEQPRRDGLVAFPEDLGSTPAARTDACSRRARSPIWSPGRAGCYEPPARFRNW